MSTDRDVTRIVRSWLHEDAHEDADRILNLVLDEVDTTPQRSASWLARRFPFMNSSTFRVAIAAAAVIVLAFVAVKFLPGSGSVGGPPEATASPSLEPTATPVAVLGAPFPGSGSLAPGLYYMSDLRDVTSGRLVLTVPAPGWSAHDVRMLAKTISGNPDTNDFDVVVSVWVVGNLKADPCKWHGGGVQPPVGPSVDDLATALAAQAGASATVTDVTLAGYAGKRVEFSAPSGLDQTTCDEGVFSRWEPANSTDWGGFVFASDQLNTVYILDVAGKRQVIDTSHLPGTSADNITELEEVVSSIRFEP